MSWNAPGPEDRISWRTILLLVAGCGFLLIVGTQSIKIQQRAYFTTPKHVGDHEQRIKDLEIRVRELEARDRPQFTPPTAPEPVRSHLQQPGESYRDWYRRVGPIIPSG